MRGLPKFNFLFLQPANLIGPLLKKKLKLWKLPKIKGSILKYRVSHLWPTYTGERTTTFAKVCWIKVRCYGEHVGEHIGNLRNILGTHWELERNMVDTHWERGKNEKILSLPPCPLPQDLKEKKQGTLSACLGLPIGCMKFLFPK
jgi:hypothetical protein